MAELTFSQVDALLKYDPETGKLFWKERDLSMFSSSTKLAKTECSRWNNRYSGEEAFTTRHTKGYATGSIYGRMYKAHRVVWLLQFGVWPSGQIDHINGNPADNRVSNLRVVTNSENCKNQRLNTKNTTGVVGVHWNKQCGKWQAQIRIKQAKIHLGLFINFDDAVIARKSAEVKYGFHPNHGRNLKSPSAHLSAVI